ncbi:hypothetical protein CIPAW_03G064000 [Carya illinoinensis]|uniref:Uncharacterized protein n=1 Tax=Carya illinoinensis TaxID=32201 RepID=A0A8T1QXJ6_CARIL|nr:hypothetical protein CIPAW_03G064000 [Carya illinoinensis]
MLRSYRSIGFRLLRGTQRNKPTIPSITLGFSDIFFPE